MTTLFQHYPAQPVSAQCQKAFLILCNAHDTATSFLDIFGTIRRNRAARGAPTDEEQDLMRAMLLFASAGLDSLAKQLISDALPSILESDEAAGKMFKSYVQQRLKRGEDINYAMLADVVGDHRPRERLVAYYVRDLCASSLQSTEELLKAGAAFDIPSIEITTDPRGLTEVFRVRNQIVHEMDVDFAVPNRNRTPRAKQVMVDHANTIFGVAKSFLTGVDQRIPV